MEDFHIDTFDLVSKRGVRVIVWGDVKSRQYKAIAELDLTPRQARELAVKLLKDAQVTEDHHDA